MTSTSELQLPDPLALYATSDVEQPDSRPDSANADNKDRVALSPGLDSRSPFSDDGFEVESNFSSLLLSVAGRDAFGLNDREAIIARSQTLPQKQSQPSAHAVEHEGQDVDGQVDGDDSYSVISGPSASITGIPHSNRPISIGAVLDQVAQTPANHEQFEAWMQQGRFWDGRVLEHEPVETPVVNSPEARSLPSLACPTVSSIYPQTSAASSAIHIDTDDANLSLSISASGHTSPILDQSWMAHSTTGDQNLAEANEISGVAVGTLYSAPGPGEDGPSVDETKEARFSVPSARSAERKALKWRAVAPDALQLLVLAVFCLGNLPRVADPTFSKHTAGRSTPDPADLIIVSLPKVSNVTSTASFTAVNTPSLNFQSAPTAVDGATWETSTFLAYLVPITGLLFLRWVYRRIAPVKDQPKPIVRPGSKRRIHIRSNAPSSFEDDRARAAMVKQAVEASVKPYPASKSPITPTVDANTLGARKPSPETTPTKSILKRVSSSTPTQSVEASPRRVSDTPSPLPKQARFDTPVTRSSTRVLRSTTTAGRQSPASTSKNITSVPIAAEVAGAGKGKGTPVREQSFQANSEPSPSQVTGKVVAPRETRVPEIDLDDDHRSEESTSQGGAGSVPEEARPASFRYKYESSHVVHVHGPPGVGKSSVILRARQMDLPEVPQDAGIRSHCLGKQQYGINLIYRDTGVTDDEWAAWTSQPSNAKIISQTVSGTLGRKIRLFVHSAVDDASKLAAYREALPYLHERDSLLVMMLNKTDLLAAKHAAVARDMLRVSEYFFARNGITPDTIRTRIKSFAVSADNADGVSEAFRDLARELRGELIHSVSTK